ncbi:MAG: phospholipid carrier-dependent glycosyltransferase [PVC group bacterium]
MKTASLKTGTVKTFIPAVILLFLLLYIIPLGNRPLIIPDESRYAEIPREMRASGDWIVPRLNGIRYFEKPVLGYWLTAAALGLFGENAFAVRFPSALAAGASAMILFLLLAGSGRGWRAGFLSAAAYLTSLEVFAVGTINLLDSLFTLFITAAMAAFFFAYRKGRPGARIQFLIAGGIFAGLAFLTKGFIAFAIPAIVIVPFMLWEGRGRELIRNCWVPGLSAALIALPWAVMIHFREPDFWNYFFWTEHIQRFLSSDPQHPEPVWFFLHTILWGALPWIMLLPAAVSGLSGKFLRDPLLRYTTCWFSLSFLLFSLSRGKLVTYILPCYPPLVILLLLGILEYFARGKKKMFNGGALVLGALLIILAAGLIVLQTTGFPVQGFFHRRENWKWIIAADGLLIWSFCLIVSARQKEPFKKLLLFCAAPVFLFFASHFILPEAGEEGKAPENFLRDNLSAVKPETILVSDGHCTAALCWFYDRDDVLLLEYDGELEYGLSYDDAQGRFLSFEQFREMAGAADRTKSIFLFLDRDRFEKCSGELPPATAVETGDGFTLARFESLQKPPH